MVNLYSPPSHGVPGAPGILHSQREIFCIPLESTLGRASKPGIGFRLQFLLSSTRRVFLIDPGSIIYLF